MLKEIGFNVCMQLELQGQECQMVARHGPEFLSTIAECGYPAVSRLCLELIFERGHAFLNYRDALNAYARFPLPEPPAEYVSAFHAIDWTVSLQTQHLRAIILAGSTNPQDKRMLMDILCTAEEDFRCGPLLAASSFDDPAFLRRLCEIAMSVRDTTAFATGEIHSLRFAFRNWLDRKFATYDLLLRELSRFEKTGDKELLSARRLLNYVHCPGWNSLPFPDELPLVWK